MRSGRVVLLYLSACSTLATQGVIGQNLPSSGAGPFQALAQTQVAPADVAPYVCLVPGQSLTEPSVLSASGDVSSPAAIVYAVASGPKGRAVVRTHADDGVSFYGDTADQSNHPSHRPPVVLSASLGWEGNDLSGPSALRSGSQIWLYYAGSGGIGLAQSSDGITFTKTGEPVLAPDPAASWETTSPHAPTVAIFPDGSWHMLYAAGTSIGEATSTDGLHWTRAAGNPVLEPSAPVDPKTLPAGEHPPFDEGTVEDPLLAPRIDATGQLQVRVLYAGYAQSPTAQSRTASIGFAARYGGSGPLSRQSIPVYVAPGSTAAGPTLLEWGGGTRLYVSQLDTTLMPSLLALAAAYDPAGESPPVGKYPASP
jgi:hypothetical protein